MQRFVAIGDIHGEDASLERVLEFSKTWGADAVLAVGDIVDGPGDVDRCLSLLETHGVHTVRGNHERWLLEGSMRSLPGASVLTALSPTSIAFLNRLPKTQRFDTPEGGLLLCHGLGDDDMCELRPDHRGYALQSNDSLRELRERTDLAYVVHGHTHCRMTRKLPPIWFVNPGTLFREHTPGFFAVDLAAKTVEIYELATGEPTLSSTASLA